MKNIAFFAAHYGREFLAWSIRSIQDHVDEIHVIYTPTPSFGYQTSLQCPETEEELKKEAHRFLNKPIFWHRGTWRTEGEHRGAIRPIARDRGADLILVVDADEIWDPDTLGEAIEGARQRGAENTLVGFCHLWRSFHWICNDGAMPVRIIQPGATGTGGLPSQKFPVFHFGYAQTPGIVSYKQDIHGHKGEWRADWFQKKFMAWSPDNPFGDVHPTNVDFWTPTKTTPDVHAKLKELAGDHPWFEEDMIK